MGELRNSGGYMCGFCGILEFGSGSIITEELLKKMCAVLQHRGPDDQGIYIKRKDGVRLGLGHRRLAVIDLNTGRQPISNEDDTIWVAYNGEIYNFMELREGLEKKGHRFKTRTDTEVIVHLYEEHGTGFVRFLRGMFGIALWDEKEERLVLVRDRIGKKPVCYALAPGRLIFASEIKSILEVPGISREVNLTAMHHFLTYQYVPSPISIFRGISKLPAAHMLVWEKGSAKVEKYWELDYGAKIKISPAEAQERIIGEFRESTKMRLVSDVPLGAFLSGGIDSSAVVAMMSELMPKPVKTFSIGFEEQDFSELKYARMVSKMYGTDHKELIVKSPNVPELLPKLVWYYNEPYADSSAIPTYCVSKMTREHVTVALNGDGGDENFAGYPRYQQRKLVDTVAGLYNILPGFKKNWISRIAGSQASRSAFWRKVKWAAQASGMSPERRYARFMTVFPNDYKEKLYSDTLKKELAGMDSIDLLADACSRVKADNIVERIIGSDIITYLPDCLCVKMDIAASANSLETRAPLLDHRFMEFTASLPPGFKLNGFTTKYVFKKALEKYLPKEVLYRKKMGFGVPITHWFKKDLKDYARGILLGESAKRRGYFRTEYVKQLLDEHASGTADHTTRIWALLNLELWHQVFIDAK